MSEDNKEIQVTEQSILAEIAEATKEVEQPQETKTESKDAVEIPKQTEQVPEFEVKAREQGWKPKEEWISAGNDPDDWKPPKVYVKDGELFEHIKSQSKTIKDLQKQVETVVKHAKTVAETTRERTIAELTKIQADAVEVGDVETVKRVTSQIVDIHKTPVIEEPKVDPQKEIQQAVSEFRTKNKWYDTDRQLHFAAKAIEAEILSTTPNLAVKELLDKVEDEVKKTFPHKFENTLQSKPQTVVGSSNEAPSTKQAKKLGWNDLSSELKDVYTVMKKNGVYSSIDEFIQDNQKYGVI